MSISFLTDNPARLLKDFKKKIDDGKIVTWLYDKDGDFTHAPVQWKNKAWLKPTEETDRLRFNIISNTKCELTMRAYLDRLRCLSRPPSGSDDPPLPCSLYGCTVTIDADGQ